MLIVVAAAVAPNGIHAQETAGPTEPAAAPLQRVRPWQLRFGFLVADTTGDASVAAGPGAVDVRFSGGGGGFVNLERQLTPLVGFEFALIGMGTDLNVSAGSGTKHDCCANVNVLATGSLTLGVNFHFVKDGPIDVYAGPFVAFNRYADVSTSTWDWDYDWPPCDDDWVTVQARSDSEVTWGAKAGLDIYVGKRDGGRWGLP